MPSLEYLGMAGSSKHSTHCSAGVHTGGGCEGQGEGADMTVLWGVDRLPQQAANIIRAGGAGSSWCQAFRAHPALRVGGFLWGSESLPPYPRWHRGWLWACRHMPGALQYHEVSKGDPNSDQA